MFDRVMRAVRLDATLFREVADNEQYTNEAFIIVLIVSFFSASGAAVSAAMADGQPLLAFFSNLLSTILLGWLLWAVIAYYVGTALEGKSSIVEMARTLGYANAPGLLGLFAFIPCVGRLAALAGVLLSLAAGVIAIRESMEFDTTKAVVTAVLGFIVFIIVRVVIGFVMGGIGTAGSALFG
jgi:MFS family permease